MVTLLETLKLKIEYTYLMEEAKSITSRERDLTVSLGEANTAILRGEGARWAQNRKV